VSVILAINKNSRVLNRLQWVPVEVITILSEYIDNAVLVVLLTLCKAARITDTHDIEISPHSKCNYECLTFTQSMQYTLVPTNTSSSFGGGEDVLCRTRPQMGP